MLYDPKHDNRLKTEPWRQVLLDAADLIERDGWCQKAFFRRNRSCVDNAMMQVAISTDLYLKARDHLEIAVGQPPVVWNDKKSRTKKEVMTKLREVAWS